jgi:MFS family permease
MNDQSPVEIADRISRKRARMWGALAVIFLASQAAFAPWTGPARLAHVKPWLWIVLCLAILANLATGGGLFLSRKVRALLNDEVSASHRHRAMATGFWVAMAMGLVIYVLGQFDSVTGAEGAYLTVTISLASALITFAFLERRAHRDA